MSVIVHMGKWLMGWNGDGGPLILALRCKSPGWTVVK